MRLEQLKEERSEHAAKLSQSENERQQCVLAAKIDGNAKAQKRLQELEQQTDFARRAVADEDAAIAEIGRRLDVLRRQRNAAAIEEKRSRIRKIIDSRLDLGPERQLALLMEELAKRARAILAEDQRLASELRAFDTSMEKIAQGLELRSAACHCLLALRDIEQLDLCNIESEVLNSALRAVAPVGNVVEA
jgi:hypothetical protein